MLTFSLKSIRLSPRLFSNELKRSSKIGICLEVIIFVGFCRMLFIYKIQFLSEVCSPVYEFSKRIQQYDSLYIQMSESVNFTYEYMISFFYRYHLGRLESLGLTADKYWEQYTGTSRKNLENRHNLHMRFGHTSYLNTIILFMTEVSDHVSVSPTKKCSSNKKQNSKT